MKILLVDDDTIQVESLMLGLKSRGYQVRGTSSVEDALSCIEEEAFDLVVTDFYMPGSSGLELLRSLREKSIRLPVIMMTGYADKDLVIDALHSRCDAFIEKPFTLDHLVRIIEKVTSDNAEMSNLIKLGETIHKSTMGESLKRTYDILDAFDSLLEIWLEDLPLEELLDKVLSRILDIPWLSETGQGGIFLLDRETETLVIKVKDYFPEVIQKQCTGVPVGKCFCGKAAGRRKTEFCTHKSGRDFCPPGETFLWNNYCVPIIYGDEVLGVLTIILEPNHGEDAVEKKFLVSVSNIIAGIIHRKSAEKEKEKVETLLRHAQKMHAIGSLTGGIAHDFNNLIQVILGFTQLILLNAGPDHPEYEKMKEIESAAQKARTLTRQLLTFSRKIDAEYRQVDLNQQIRKTKRLLARMLPKTVSIELLLDDNLKLAYLDPNQIEQVLVNLCLNARDAMPEGGTITIETRNVFLDESFCKTHALSMPGEYIYLSVTDSGEGMDKYTMEHMYEPFFTTKKPGEGTGLGLSIVYGIIGNHGGQIICYSEQGVGTTFKMYLPVNSMDKDDKALDQENLDMEGSETILLIDDEEPILKIAKGVLEIFGYKTYLATGGREGLELFQRKKDEIDLVVLDLMMPGMDGVECLRELSKHSPRPKVLVASGYAVGESISSVLKLGASGIIRKPFEIKQMLKTVRDVLDGKKVRINGPDYIV